MTYTQGHSSAALALQVLRTAHADAGFLAPHLKPTDHLLDIGCGAGTITTGFADFLTKGKVAGVDQEGSVLEKARQLVGDKPVVFEQGDILAGLPYADGTFDVIYASQLFGHLKPPEQPLRALQEIKRPLKPGGIIATRDGIDNLFYPLTCGLDKLYQERAGYIWRHGVAAEEATGINMPRFLRQTGFSKIEIGSGTRVLSGNMLDRLATRTAQQLSPGDAFYDSWLAAGFTTAQAEETVEATKKWAATEDAFAIIVQLECLAWT